MTLLLEIFKLNKLEKVEFSFCIVKKQRKKNNSQYIQSTLPPCQINKKQSSIYTYYIHQQNKQDICDHKAITKGKPSPATTIQ